jgi:hypothetical protein
MNRDPQVFVAPSCNAERQGNVALAVSSPVMVSRGVLALETRWRA